VNEVHGFKELADALAEFPKATGKNTLRRAGKKAMKRIEDGMAQRAPREEGTLAESMRTQEVKARRQRGSVRFDAKNSIEFITGPAPEGRMDRANAGFQEYGTVKMAANAYARPTADAENEKVVDDLREFLAEEIHKTAARIERKAARAG
jgi:HK97 gp10 family phage protein